MFRGNSTAKIDEKGRLKLPAVFRALIGEHYGNELFVTSLTGECVWIYPMHNWIAVEEQLAKAPSTNPSVRKYRDRVNFYGQATSLDGQGRVLIQLLLREQSRMDGEVVVLGTGNRLEVWNRSVFEERLISQPVSDEDLDVLSQYGI